ncbi:MAG TPA: RNase H family protein [Solirubrobacterales bacterium]|nr:RNase H family protein [Solirubrobacterales bacterium]
MEYPDEDTVNIYTDGSSLPAPRRGGLAITFLIIDEAGEEQVHELVPPGYSGATNNQMELEACVQALNQATGQQPPFDRSLYRKVVIRTDSVYVAGNYETALFTWSTNGWLKKDGGPVDNAGQWKDLVRLLKRSAKQGRSVTIKWVPGKKSPRTKQVDKAAKRAAKHAPSRLLAPAEVRRKRSEQPIEIGGVPMEGQVMQIHIFKSEFQRVHRLLKCWYSVESDDSPYFERVSVIYADPESPLRRGHSFTVRVNLETRNPRVLEVIEEVD